MKLAEFLREKRWNAAIFAKEYNMNDAVVRKVVNGTGSINLDTALQIEAATKGKVKVWDMSANAEKIKERLWPEKSKRFDRHTTKKDAEPHNELNGDIEKYAS